MPLILASLGLGSFTTGQWIPNNKGLFLGAAMCLMSFSLLAAIREKKNTGRSAGLIISTIALLITFTLLSYTKIRYGYFM